MRPSPFRRSSTPRRAPALALRAAVSLALAGTLCLALPAFAQSTPAAAAAPAVTVQTKGEKLKRLYEQYWEEQLKLNPLRATAQGDARYNDQLPNFASSQFRKQSREFTQRLLKTIEAVG